MNPEILQAVERMTEAVRRRARSIAMTRYVKAGQYKTEDTFRRQLWRAALELFRGDIDEFAFIDDYSSSIENQLTRAWNEGARSVDVDPREFTNEDVAELNRIIANEYDFILRLADDIITYRDEGNKIDDFRDKFRGRVELWVNRYRETINNARIWFDSKAKLEWVLGLSEHCDTCLQLSGIVAYAGEWEQAKIRPQNPPNGMLVCQGWNCKCTLVPTTRRRSPRALDQLIAIALARPG